MALLGHVAPSKGDKGAGEGRDRRRRQQESEREREEGRETQRARLQGRNMPQKQQSKKINSKKELRSGGWGGENDRQTKKKANFLCVCVGRHACACVHT